MLYVTFMNKLRTFMYKLQVRTDLTELKNMLLELETEWQSPNT